MEHADYGTIVPQPNTANLLDNLADRIMQKVQYRKVGRGRVAVGRPHGAAGDRINRRSSGRSSTSPAAPSPPTAVQQQIYSPDTTLYRFMPSLAVDNQGNMAIGFSTSGPTVPNFPSIEYVGRLAGDPLNTLPQTEVTLIAGLGSQTNHLRRRSRATAGAITRR